MPPTLSNCLLGALLPLVLLGCGINSLKQDLEDAEANLRVIKVEALSPSQADGLLQIILFRREGDQLRISTSRSPEPGNVSYFLVPDADYTLMAFEDLNRDFIYQPGEPAAITREPKTLITHPGEDLPADEELDGNRLTLTTATRLPLTIDLSLDSVAETVIQSERNYLVLTDWSNPAFDDANVKKGLWQPMAFHEETGFGLYLLEPLDPQRQPVVLVHGISGSPRNFQALAEALGDSYQLLLYHYPSGFPLEHTAYILRIALRELVIRYDYERVDIIAHSMGGLVARDTIVRSDPSVTDHLGKFISLSTPWSGHEAARLGVKYSPTVAPVWRSMVPNSEYQQGIFSRPIPTNMQHHLFFAFAHRRGGDSKGDDGVVSVASQLQPQAQKEAWRLYGVDDSHNGILENPQVQQVIQSLLATE